MLALAKVPLPAGLAATLDGEDISRILLDQRTGVRYPTSRKTKLFWEWRYGPFEQQRKTIRFVPWFIIHCITKMSNSARVCVAGLQLQTTALPRQAQDIFMGREGLSTELNYSGGDGVSRSFGAV